MFILYKSHCPYAGSQLRLARLPPGQPRFTRRFGIRYRGRFGNYIIYYRVGGSGEGPLNFFALLKPPVRTDF